jgi:hypothetical protein
LLAVAEAIASQIASIDGCTAAFGPVRFSIDVT